VVQVEYVFVVVLAVELLVFGLSGEETFECIVCFVVFDIVFWCVIDVTVEEGGVWWLVIVQVVDVILFVDAVMVACVVCIGEGELVEG